jgi:hypothetical protein
MWVKGLKKILQAKAPDMPMQAEDSASFHPAPAKWRFIVVLKPSFKRQLVCRL